MLDCLEHTPGGPIDSAIVWMHGLGASGFDFAPLVPHIGLQTTRYVFPHAPERPVTVNGGEPMPAWYDILTMDRVPNRESARDVREAHLQVEELVQRELDRGVPANRIVLAGSSQGAAMTVYTGTRSAHRFAGLMVLSGYLILEDSFDAEQHPSNRTTPLLAMHGTRDEVVAMDLGRRAYDRLAPDREGTWKTYPMAHELCGPQIRDIRAWLHGILPAQ